MRIHRLQTGLIKWHKEGVPVRKKIFRFRYAFTHCNCHTVEIGPVYTNWLSDECLPSSNRDIVRVDVDFNDEDQT
jgi:hypothetical protein